MKTTYHMTGLGQLSIYKEKLKTIHDRWIIALYYSLPHNAV